MDANDDGDDDEDNAVADECEIVLYKDLQTYIFRKAV